MNNKYYGTLIFELSKAGRKGYSLPRNNHKNLGLDTLPKNLMRATKPELPEVDELTVVRHYTNMSNNNFGVDTGFYPLGSCTMKYNPKINEEMCALPQFARLHPLQPALTAQGALEAYYTVQKMLSSIAGLAEFTLNPFAGAHGELTGMMILRAYHDSRGDTARRRIIVPDSAHGTNPASAAIAGFQVVQVKSRPDGTVDVDDLRPLLDETVAGMMMTNPNTLGIFERNCAEIA
ncbi:MAG: aminomethyl-transferring glycine dehydrogenase subunit GcvPB, partial [Muribaculaceae bacterium]|nr:aminomethyl-transferring glycine dehydrogenase subunit GcvPB [Muribaculaceae bacterium]